MEGDFTFGLGGVQLAVTEVSSSPVPLPAAAPLPAALGGLGPIRGRRRAA